jgi:hypothetical protein
LVLGEDQVALFNLLSAPGLLSDTRQTTSMRY